MKSAITVLVLVGTLMTGTVTAFVNYAPDRVDVAPKTSTKSVTVEEVNKEPVVEETPTPVQPTQEPVETPPVILSTQEYGAMYLDLSGENQACFDKIVSTWPDRFTENVREGNVKALRIFATVCSTGINQSRNGAIGSYGPNGAFFDSEVATQYKS